MKKIFQLATFAAAVLACISCSKLIDGISPKNAIRTDELTEGDISLLTNGTMHQFEAFVSNVWFEGDYLAENFTGGPGFTLSDVHAETQSASSPTAKSRWQYCYGKVNYANQLLSSAMNAKSDNDDVRYAKGVAYFFRAYIYYHLAIRYGGVPIIEKPAMLEVVPRSTEEEVFDFIKSDIQKAESCLDHFTSFANPSLEALWMLEAKVHLWLGEKPDAIQAANKVIEGNRFTFSRTSADFASMFINGTSSAEIIFAPVNIRSKDYIRLFETVNDTDGSFNYSPTEELHSSLYADPAYASADIRKAATFTDADKTRVIKFPNGSLSLNQFVFNQAPSESPLMVFRLADAYLLLAEAHGNTPAGKDALKSFLESRYASVALPQDCSDSEYEAILLDENRREFYAEGRRWFDVKRFGLLYHVSDFSTWIDTQYDSWDGRDFLLYWPVPQDERDKANGAYTQNPGYEQ